MNDILKPVIHSSLPSLIGQAKEVEETDMETSKVGYYSTCKPHTTHEQHWTGDRTWKIINNIRLYKSLQSLHFKCVWEHGKSMSLTQHANVSQ